MNTLDTALNVTNTDGIDNSVIFGSTNDAIAVNMQPKEPETNQQSAETEENTTTTNNSNIGSFDHDDHEEIPLTSEVQTSNRKKKKSKHKKKKSKRHKKRHKDAGDREDEFFDRASRDRYVKKW